MDQACRDWKNQSRNAFDWLLVALAAVLLLLYLYQWWQRGGRLPLGLAAALTAGGVVYFSGYWQPILYLLATVVLTVATVGWIWLGEWHQPVAQVTIALHVVVGVLTVYLFNYEEPGLPPERDPE